ncbi:MAG: hypothetical protein H6814_08770 [Phycisphaeraceae bacterium]|nr:hypothetical protein [Phycisphaeraceae bacterium]
MLDLEGKAIRHMYQSEPRMFFQLAFRLLHPNVEYLPNWSIDLLGEALKRCHRRETKRLIVNMPPRSLKSICASVAFPAWLLGIEPESKVMCVAGHKGLADDQHDLTRRLMTHPKYRALFPHVRVNETTGALKLAQGGLRASFTPSGALTGRGADVIIIDDPQSAHEADDGQKSDSIRSWYDRNIYQRLDDKHDGVIIVVMQRLAHDDLTAHLLKQDGWELLRLPAIATEDERLPEPLGGGIARRKGEALHPIRESRDQLREAMLRMGAKAFMAQYQQEPYPEGKGGDRGGAFHMAPHPDATEDECRHTGVFFALIEEEHFVLDRVFGERTRLRPGAPPPLSGEEWMAQTEGPRLPERGLP